MKHHCFMNDNMYKTTKNKNELMSFKFFIIMQVILQYQRQ